MKNNAVEIDRLTVRRGGRPVLDGLSAAVGAATVTGLLGPSGCGKTTLMRAVLGVQRIEAGSVRVLGQPAGSRPLRDRVACMPQRASVYADLSVRENLRYFAAMLGLGHGAVVRALAEVHLESSADTLVARLSGGQQARVSLATALLGQPELLILDEPTVGLDPLLRQDLWQLFRRLADQGTTLLVSSHVMDEASRCDQLLLLRAGRLLATGTPSAIRERTGQEDLEQAFIRLVDQPGNETAVRA